MAARLGIPSSRTTALSVTAGTQPSDQPRN
uniref:Uncharacterized protein n=1 Tax=Arundo donax TaxID=35708 RepID=A0A0A9B3R2_ARUDO